MVTSQLISLLNSFTEPGVAMFFHLILMGSGDWLALRVLPLNLLRSYLLLQQQRYSLLRGEDLRALRYSRCTSGVARVTNAE